MAAILPSLAFSSPALFPSRRARRRGGSLREGQAYSVNGQRPESNNFLIDGADNFNGADGGFVLKPPVDGSANFVSLPIPPTQNLGHSTGSTTNIITSLRHEFLSMRAWEFLRNDAFDAKVFCAKCRAFEARQSVHPRRAVKHDKTFFFRY